ncbi:unnamed protein product [Mycena citricolor]|uniref:BRCT domain-containing protein n=1 Tax=Mycena citricolor TaxID=2018698 RepID=A0AAD2GRD4_9AGAR|nr:unnamed protein product [Mycena citricolor]
MSIRMLFEAVFSPDVRGTLRSIWVKHGGAIAKNSAEFFHARYFFCTGLEDVWFAQLKAMGLMIRHPSWISVSAEEGLEAPVSKYILDERFEEEKIRSLSEGSPSHSSASTQSKPMRMIEAFPLSPKLAPAANPLKRSLDSEFHDQSLIDLDPRPSKRTRLHSCSPQDKMPSAQLTVPSPSGPEPVPMSSTPPQTDASILSSSPILPNGSCSVFPTSTIRISSIKSKALSLEIFPRLSRKKHHKTQFTRIHRRKSFQFSVTDLLRKPRVQAGIFTPFGQFEGKAFSC